MAEMKEASQSQSHLTQQFIQFVMMQAQQASVFLGKIPNPVTNTTEKKPELARIFIDQLEMIREKTRGNLTAEESEILSHILSDLQFAYVEVASHKEEKQPSQEKIEKDSTINSPGTANEEKKKFSKNYGA